MKTFQMTIVAVACLQISQLNADEPCPLTENARNVLYTLSTKPDDSKVDVMLRLEDSQVANDLTYSVLPVESDTDKEALQIRRFREIEMKIRDLKLSSVGPMDEENSLIRPSRIIRSRSFYQVRVVTTCSAVAEVTGRLTSIHPAIAEIDIVPLENMILSEASPKVPLSIERTQKAVRAVEGCSLSQESSVTGVLLLGSNESVRIYEIEPDALDHIDTLFKRQDCTVRFATYKDLDSIRTPVELESGSKETLSELCRLCPRARILRSEPSTLSIAINAHELSQLREAGINVR